MTASQARERTLFNVKKHDDEIMLEYREAIAKAVHTRQFNALFVDTGDVNQIGAINLLESEGYKITRIPKVNPDEHDRFDTGKPAMIKVSW